MAKGIIRVVRDDESGKKIKITQDMIIEYGKAISLYREGIQKTNQGVFSLILSVGPMIDKKLYLAAGYTNVESFAVDDLGMSRRHAYRFYELYKKLPAALVTRVAQTEKAPSFRRLLALPNDTNLLENLSEEDLESMAGMSDAEFDAEMTKISGYDRKKHGGRGPSDLERARISRDRYRDQKKKIHQLEEKLNTSQGEKDELVDEIEKMEKVIADLKRVTSPDKDKNELIQENKALLLRLAEAEKLVKADKTLSLQGELGMQRVVIAVSECSAVFNKLGKVELTSHEQWVEFRAYTDTIRHLLELCEERVGATMAEKGLHPKEYEEWHEGSFKYHLDKATETMRKEYAEKTEKESADMIKKSKEERQQRKKNKKK